MLRSCLAKSSIHRHHFFPAPPFYRANGSKRARADADSIHLKKGIRISMNRSPFLQDPSQTSASLFTTSSITRTLDYFCSIPF